MPSVAGPYVTVKLLAVPDSIVAGMPVIEKYAAFTPLVVHELIVNAAVPAFVMVNVLVADRFVATNPKSVPEPEVGAAPFVTVRPSGPSSRSCGTPPTPRRLNRNGLFALLEMDRYAE